MEVLNGRADLVCYELLLMRTEKYTYYIPTGFIVVVW